MIVVSKLAASVLFETMRASHLSSNESLRLAEEDGVFSLRVDIPGNSDRVVRYEGEVVLVIAKALETAIGDARIDLEETLEGNNLVMRRAPNSNFLNN